MGLEETKKPRPFGEPREQCPIVARQPAIEGPVAHAFEGVEQPQGDHLTGPEVRLRMFGDGAQLLIDLKEQRGDKLHGGHTALLSEAVRKHHSLVVKLSSRFLAISESRTRARRKPVKHKINVTNLNHDGARCWLALIVFTVPTIPAVPGVGAFHHPALPQGRQTCAALWAGLDFETPCGTMGGHPGLEIVIVVLLVPEDGLQEWEACGRDERE